MIEVRYAGVVVGRSAIIRELDTRGLFLGITEPLPVGTEVLLRIGDRPGAEEVVGKVETVSESQELARAGMRVRFADARAATLFGTPSEAPPEPEPEPIPVVAEPAAAPAIDSAVRSGEPSASDQSASALPGGPRRIVVDASLERARDTAAPPEPTDEADVSGANTLGDSGRIPAPDPSAFGGPGGGGKKGRRNKRR